MKTILFFYFSLVMKRTVFCFLAFFISHFAFSQSPHLSASTHQYLWKQKNIYNNTPKILPECVYRQDANGRIYLSTFIQVSPSINETDLRNLDIIIGSKSKNIWTAFIPLENVNAFTQISGIKYIDVDRPIASSMDSARVTTRVDSVHAGINLPQAYTGNGVVVGIIDAGFDYTHPSVFDTSYSQFRLKKVWETKGIGTPPAAFGYGAEYTDSTSIFNKNYDVYTFSHGAHVAGIAAGSGYIGNSSINKKFRGMAYESDLVFVGIYPSLNMWLNTGLTDLMDGMNYIFDYADSQSKPAVANLSWGNPIGPHDGLSLFSQGCDNATGAGKIFTISAGNNNGRKVHIQKIFSSTDTIVSTFNNFAAGLPSKTNWVDIWGDTLQDFKVQVKLYSGPTAVATSVIYSLDNQTNQIELIGSNGDTCFVTLTALASDINGKSHALLDIYSKVNDRVLISVIAESGKIDMWQGYVLNASGYYGSFAKNAYTFATDGNDIMAASDAASTNSAIAVGAYNSKTSYVNVSGNTMGAPGETLGDICSFSSEGPTADGRTKPNITGPGSRIASSISSVDSVYLLGGSNYNIVTNKFVSPLNGITYSYAAIQGTSMSSPAVAGIVALMLEADPTLTPIQVQTLMYNTAIQDSFTGVLPFNGNNVWGWGKINAYAAIYATLNFAGIYHDVNSNLNALLYPNPSNGNYSIELKSEKNETITISLFDLNGKLMDAINWNVILGTNTIHPSWNNLSSGVYLVKILGEHSEMNVKLVVD